MLAWKSARAGGRGTRGGARCAARPSAREVLHWLALSATGSVMLLAVTNHVTQNVAAIPLLWLAPLTLYLLTFILAFEGGLYRSEIFWSFCLVWLMGMAWLLVDTDYQFDLAVQLGMFLSGLFVTCLFCHGELYRLRPAPRHLTAFYLTVSAGGALGGLLVAVVAPLAFNGYHELGLAMIAVAFLAALRCATLHLVARNMSLAVLMGVTGAAIYDGLRFSQDVRLASRNFYGVLRVKEYGTPGEREPPAAPAARRDHARRAVPASGPSQHGDQLLPAQLGHRRGAARAARQAGCDARRGDRPGDRDARRLRAQGRHLPLLRHQSRG